MIFLFNAFFCCCCCYASPLKRHIQRPTGLNVQMTSQFVVARTSAGSYRSDTASRFSLIIVSITTWKTTWMLEVSVAVVK